MSVEYSILLLGLDNAGKTTLLNQIKALYNVTNGSITPDESAADLKAGDTVPTVGQNVAVINQPEMYLKIWDVGGQMTLRRLWTSYYKSCHAVIFVVDSSDLGTLDAELLEDGGLKTPTTPGDENGPRKWHGRRKSSYNIHSSVPISPRSENIPVNRDTDKRAQRITPSLITSHSGQSRLDECRAVLESVLSHPDMSGIPILVLANKQDREDCLEVVRIKEGFVRKVFEGDKGGLVRDSRVLPVSALKGTGVQEAVEWIKKRVVGNKLGRAPMMR